MLLKIDMAEEENKIPPKMIARFLRSDPLQLFYDQMRSMFEVEGMSTRAMAQELEWNPQTVANTLAALGMYSQRPGRKEEVDVALILSMHEQGLSQTEIAARYRETPGVVGRPDQSAVRKILRRHGIK